MGAIAESLRQELAAPEPDFAEGYAESFLNTWIAAQIKVLRLQRGMTQGKLAAILETSQAVVSRVENVNYSAWNIGTLKKLARAFEVRLKVTFEEYGTLPDEIEGFSEERLQKVQRSKDPGLVREAPKNITLMILKAPIPNDDFNSNGNSSEGAKASEMGFVVGNSNNSNPGSCAPPGSVYSELDRNWNAA